MMEQLTPVRSLFEDSKSFDGKTVRVGGWVRNLRASKNFGFINLSGGVGIPYRPEQRANDIAAQMEADGQVPVGATGPVVIPIQHPNAMNAVR